MYEENIRKHRKRGLACLGLALGLIILMCFTTQISVKASSTFGTTKNITPGGAVPVGWVVVAADSSKWTIKDTNGASYGTTIAIVATPSSGYIKGTDVVQPKLSVIIPNGWVEIMAPASVLDATGYVIECLIGAPYGTQAEIVTCSYPSGWALIKAPAITFSGVMGTFIIENLNGAKYGDKAAVAWYGSSYSIPYGWVATGSGPGGSGFAIEYIIGAPYGAEIEICVCSYPSAGWEIAKSPQITTHGVMGTWKIRCIIGPVAAQSSPTLISEITVTAKDETGTRNDVDMGKSLQMSATISPVNSTNKNISWAVSAGTGLANISSEGVLTGISGGTVTVIASSSDGSGVIGCDMITINNTSAETPIQSASWPSGSADLRWNRLGNGGADICIKNYIESSSMFVGVGAFGTIYTSKDGISWLPIAETGCNIYAITYGNGIYVAVGSDSTNNAAVLISADGTIWTPQTIDRINKPDPEKYANSLRGIAFGNGTFVATGCDGNILTSQDGVMWVLQNSGSNANFTNIAYGNNMFVTLGSNSMIYTSRDGIKWSSQSAQSLATASKMINSVNSVEFSNGLFLAVGSGKTILSSPDGMSWSAKSCDNSSDWLIDAVYANGMYIAVGVSWDNNFEGFIMTSSDGVHWVYDRSEAAHALDRVVYGDSKYVVTGDVGTVLTSADGTTWSARSSCSSENLNDITYGNGLFASVGDLGTVRVSNDGIAWSSVSSGTSNNLSKIAFGNGAFVACGEKGTILTSYDGRTWSAQSSGVDRNLNGITYGGGLFVAVGNDGTVLTSADGITWAKQDPGIKVDLYDLVYGNNRFVAIGSDGTVIVSANAVSWSLSQVEFDDLIKIEFMSQRFFIVESNGCFLSSQDGRQWAYNYTDMFKLSDIAFGDGVFVAAGMKFIPTSGYMGTLQSELSASLSIDWSHYSSQVFSDSCMNHGLYAIAFGDNRFVAVGWGGKILSSAPIADANPSLNSVSVDGKSVNFQAYTINGFNYFKLRDLAKALNGTGKQFNVGWNGTGNAITILSHTAYTAVGGELTVTGGSAGIYGTTSSVTIYLDGKQIDLTAYTITGNNYFKLRDVGQALNFGVTWDGSANMIKIDTSSGYSG